MEIRYCERERDLPPLLSSSEQSQAWGFGFDWFWIAVTYISATIVELSSSVKRCGEVCVEKVGGVVVWVVGVVVRRGWEREGEEGMKEFHSSRGLACNVPWGTGHAVRWDEEKGRVVERRLSNFGLGRGEDVMYVHP